MKTTLEFPDALFRRAKATAAERGIPLRQLVTEALEVNLARKGRLVERPWMKGFGALHHLHKENVRIQKMIDREFGQIEPEDWD